MDCSVAKSSLGSLGSNVHCILMEAKLCLLLSLTAYYLRSASAFGPAVGQMVSTG